MLARKVRAGRAARNLSQRSAARQAGLHPDTWAKLERGAEVLPAKMECVERFLGWRRGDAGRIVSSMPATSTEMTLVHVNDGAEGMENYAIIDTGVTVELSEQDRADIVASFDVIDAGPVEDVSWHTSTDLPPGVLLVRQVREGPRYVTILGNGSGEVRMAAASNLHARRLIEGEGWSP